jgi:hypothetical protein
MRYIASVDIEITVPEGEQHPESWATDAIGEAMRELCTDARSGFTEWGFAELKPGWYAYPRIGNLDHTK